MSTAYFASLDIAALKRTMRYAKAADNGEHMWEILRILVNKRIEQKLKPVLDDREFDQLDRCLNTHIGWFRSEMKEVQKCKEEQNSSVCSYVDILTTQFHERCDGVIDFIDNKLIPNFITSEDDAAVTANLCMLYRWNAKCYRYKCMFPSSSKEEFEAHKAKCIEMHTQCMELCKQNLNKPGYIVTYYSVLNSFAVFHHVVTKEIKTAIAILEPELESFMKKIENDDGTFMEMVSSDRQIYNIIECIRENISQYKQDLAEKLNEEAAGDDYNDGIDLDKYGKHVKATRHNPDSAQDMHDMKADMKKLGLMSQNTEDPTDPMDKVRDGLKDLFIEMCGKRDGLYAELIEMILKFEAMIDLSRFKCIECKDYYGCDVFDNLCSECYEKRYDVAKRKEHCKQNMEDICIRIEWQSGRYIYYNMINMPSLCSVKILFRILNRNEYRCSNLRIDDGKYKYSRPTVHKCDYLKKDEDLDDEEKAQRKENERCITDFGVNQLTAIFMVR